MIVEIDKKSGFCFGVVYAIEHAESFLKENEKLYSLGDIVHNDEEVKRLRQKGLISISKDEYKNLQDAAVLIRAHGEPPETYKTAIKNNLTLIDASCPVVLKLQHRIRNAYEKNYQIIIYGKPGHPEINGLVGQTNGEAIVISDIEELNNINIDWNKPISIFSQTTKSPSKFYQIIEKIKSIAKNEVVVNDTICRQVSNRAPWLKQFAKNYDVIIFVAGKKSSNGKVLYGVCKNENPNSYFVSSVEEINPEWFKNAEKVGICGATSTPRWLMEQVKEKILSL